MNRTQVCQVPKVSRQESVEAVKIVPQERTSERMCEQIGVDEVHPISQDRKVLRQSK